MAENTFVESQIPLGPVLRELMLLRWVVIIAIIVITATWPFMTRVGYPVWAFALLFGAYNVVIYLLRARSTWLRSHAQIAVLDLPVAAFLYYMGQGPSGPLFAFFYLGVVTAALSMSIRHSAMYTASTIVVVMVVTPTHPGWTDAAADPRQLGVRLLTLVVLGIGGAILADRLKQALLAAQTGRDEAMRLKALQQVRREFFATAAHDLKTPLTAVKAGVGLLSLRRSEWVEPSEQDLLNNVSRNTESLEVLINDFILLNELETNTLTIRREAIDLRAVVAEALSTVLLLVQKKGQFLEVDIPGPLPVSGDMHRLEQVVVNVVFNAHHHTPSGTRIEIIGEAREDECLITVRDTGPGIVKEDLEHVFERFNRSVSPGSGSGLGLSIARSIVELHDGRIWAESEQGHGASFYIALPREKTGVHQ